MAGLKVLKQTFVALLVASCGVKTEGQTPFKTFEFRHCPTDLISDAMYVGTDVTITKCVKMCALRPWCAALIYRRQYPLCELFSETGLTVLDTTGTAGYCQYVDADNFSAKFVQLRLECSTLANKTCPGQYVACDMDRKQCIKPECPRLNVGNGSLLGNMNENGSRKQVICNPGYIKESGASITTCIDGNWIPKPQCINPCLTNPCRNAGKCVTNGTGLFCSCRPWWEGTNCETFVNPVQCGCYEDSAAAPQLPYKFTTSHTNSPIECAIHCSNFNYSIAGLEAKWHCLCGNSLDVTRKMPDSQCNMPCPEDNSKMCGDHWRINVYIDRGGAC